MPNPNPKSTDPTQKASAVARGWIRIFRIEDHALALALAVMLLLPLLEGLLRSVFDTGISGAINIIRHLGLVVALLGAAVAARKGKLLSFTAITTFLKGTPKSVAQLISGSVATAITVLLCAASIRFLITERESGSLLAYNIPNWVVLLVFPLGFTLIALRLIWHASDKWLGRGTALLAATGWIWAGMLVPAESAYDWVNPGLLVLLLATLAGAPVYSVLGGAAIILMWGEEMPLATIPLKHYSLATNAIIPTIPLFTLAGYFLAESKASERLIRVFQSLMGSFRGGPAIVTAIACAFFTTFTGASGVTILALGGLLMPVLLAAGYSERNSLGLLTGAGSLGLLFAPCVPLILYAIVASTTMANLDLELMGLSEGNMSKISMKGMFLGGIIPGVLLLGLTSAWAIWKGPRNKADRPAFNWGEACAALWEAKWELLIPLVAIGSLFSGFATPVEAAAITAFYTLVVEVFIYRDLHLFRDIPRVMTECGLLIGGVLLILGMAMGFTFYLIYMDIPLDALEWVNETIESKWVFLIALNGFLLLVGCVMDIFSAIVVVVPLIVPMGMAFGIHPVHLGIIFLANLQLGYLTPPVGMNLFLASYRFEKPLLEVYKAVIPMLLVLLIGVLLITYIPWLSTFLPDLFDSSVDPIPNAQPN